MGISKFFVFVAACLAISSVIAQSATDTVKVYGNCGMCKNRIQKSLKVEGVFKADWNPETKLLIVTYDPAKINNDDIQRKVAAVGHDTEKFMADDKVYEKLPGCCLYGRKKKNSKEDQPVHQ